MENTDQKDQYVIEILEPAACSESRLAIFHDIVVAGNQVNTNDLKRRIKAARFLAFAMMSNSVAGTASVKNQQYAYITRIFRKAGVPGLADVYQTEIGYVVTVEDYRRMGISTALIKALIEKSGVARFYATTKNDDMRPLLIKLGFTKTGNSYYNDNFEKVDLYTFDK